MTTSRLRGPGGSAEDGEPVATIEEPATPHRCMLHPTGPVADLLAAALRRAGLDIAATPAEASALVWCSSSPEGLEGVLASAPRLGWVQLPIAGVEHFVPLIRGRTDLVWTCAKPAYGPVVAELALGLVVTGFRQLHRYAEARTWLPLPGRLLAGAQVTVLGAGSIGRSLVRLLEPWGTTVTVVSRSGAAIEGARALPSDQTAAAVADADAVVLAVPLTPDTEGMVDRRFLEGLRPTAWLVNVARGGVVVTADLVRALRDGTIAGACLDVTDPEPLPDGHPLWSLPNALVTPHVANTPQLGGGALAELVGQNARRFAAGERLVGVVDAVAGY